MFSLSPLQWLLVVAFVGRLFSLDFFQKVGFVKAFFENKWLNLLLVVVTFVAFGWAGYDASANLFVLGFDVFWLMAVVFLAELFFAAEWLKQPDESFQKWFGYLTGPVMFLLLLLYLAALFLVG